MMFRLYRKQILLFCLLSFISGCADKAAIDPSFTVVSDDVRAKSSKISNDLMIATSFDDRSVQYNFKEKNIVSAIHFNFDSSVVNESFIDDIERAASVIKNNKPNSVLLVGNCDHFGEAAYNLSLGKRRAEAVKSILVTYNIDESKINLASKGSSDSDFEATKEDGYKDRRVDVILQD